jgi:hypothetical protein
VNSEPGGTDPDQAGNDGDEAPEDLAPPGHPTRASDVLPLIDKEIA